MTRPASDTPAVSPAQKHMVELLATLAPTEGITQSSLGSVQFMRVNRPLPRRPVLYEPCIVVVCQGRKRGYLGSQSFVYDAQQYLVLAVPLPFECETEASEQEPLLAISIGIDLSVIAELLLALNDSRMIVPNEPRAVCATPLDGTLSDTVLRLLESLASPADSQILGPSIVREIYYRVLAGAQGDMIRAALMHQHQLGRIAKALRRIHADYRGDLDVETLAREAGMSLAVFHAQFKAVTATSPMQYVKTTRLHHARHLMVQLGVNVSTAATRVGYESASQFSREFKRLFGLSPIEEVRRMRTTTDMPPSDAVPLDGEFAAIE
ncbi:AraC family transcriptional regulator [Trinickia fusca]|uniref:AraC family transcriptional regulator n=1 Tax=Trinickia fusca TaxID=2419777 RepID=A0A494WY88_9BURK|nr:AraC family transcriptional regulator [Trinickia fusca]RKP43505.1 AraC family transcriptional regulator [Trinickia fusca]